MTNAVTKILATYDKDQLKEIADHGCQSGVCSQHIYYGDTTRFYDQYEDEIVSYIESNCDQGNEFLVYLFEKADADLTYYKNDVCWAFIEMVAFDWLENAIEEPELTEYGAVA